MLLEKGKLNSSLILDSYSIKPQIVPINIYFTGSTDLISFLEEKDDIIDLCNDKTKWIIKFVVYLKVRDWEQMKGNISLHKMWVHKLPHTHTHTHTHIEWNIEPSYINRVGNTPKNSSQAET